MNLFPCLKLRKLYQMTRRRFASGGDSIRLMVADREVVGHGINGRPIYFDSPDCPFPAIRYQEVNSKLCALREKELDDWKNLSLDEKKQLYRHSFCQTYAEFQHFTPEWKICLAVALWLVSVGIAISISMKTMLYGKLPQTFDDERQSAQLRRIIQLQMNPITGLSSKWCYQENKSNSIIGCHLKLNFSKAYTEVHSNCNVVYPNYLKYHQIKPCIPNEYP